MGDKLQKHLLSAIAILDKAGRHSSTATLSRWLHEKFESKETYKTAQNYSRPHGVSVITPTHRGEARIGRLLASIARQTLPQSLFEIIVITNGPDDGTTRELSRIYNRHPKLRLIHKHCDVASAAAARNVGLDTASMRYVTFIDDDDYISDEFLEVLLKHSSLDRIVVSSVADFGNDGINPSRLNAQTLASVGGQPGKATRRLFDVRGNLSMTCAKIAPASCLREVRFSPALRSGEDVVFWADICLTNALEVYVPPEFEQAVYFREIRNGSVSRREDQFSFSVAERLAVIRDVERLEERLDPSVLNEHGRFISSRYDGQIGFIVSYLKERLNEYSDFLVEARAQGVRDSIITKVAAAVATKTVISYCFPPSVDASSIVVMKRVLTDGKPVHVVSNNMAPTRKVSQPLLGALDGLVASHSQLNTPVSWADFSKIQQFAEQAAKITQGHIDQCGVRSVYTRSLWVPSTFAGALVKTSNPHVNWTAEFSDPNLLDIHGQERHSAIPTEWLKASGFLSHPAFLRVGNAALSSDNMFLWAELLAFALADELIFTNHLQLRYMLSQDWAAGIVDLVSSKSLVQPQPTLSPEYYLRGTSTFNLPKDRKNVGYFGSLYATRGMSELLEAIASLDASTRAKVALHIISPESEVVSKKIAELDIGDAAFSYESIDYFDCLAAYADFDYLIVNDARTKGVKSVNPYLPSKLSDYLGSGKPIWAIVEPGSTLANFNFPPRSIVTRLGSVDGYLGALRRIRGAPQVSSAKMKDQALVNVSS
jgi:glycosyltransferase involved in cell wall biosynthesis